MGWINHFTESTQLTVWWIWWIILLTYEMGWINHFTELSQLTVWWICWIILLTYEMGYINHFTTLTQLTVWWICRIFLTYEKGLNQPLHRVKSTYCVGGSVGDLELQGVAIKLHMLELLESLLSGVLLLKLNEPVTHWQELAWENNWILFI